VSSWLLAKEIMKYDPASTNSRVALSTAIAGATSQTLKLASTFVENYSNRQFKVLDGAVGLTYTLNKTRAMQLSAGLGVAADVINVMATGALLGLAIYNYENCDSNAKTVSALLITDAAIQLAFAMVELCITIAFPVGGQLIAAGLGFVALCLPSISGIYLAEELRKISIDLEHKGLVNDAYIVFNQYYATHLKSMPLLGLGGHDIDDKYLGGVVRKISGNTGWFLSTEQQRLNATLQSGALDSTIAGLNSTLRMLEATSATLIILNFDSFNYFAGSSHNYKAKIQGVNTLSVTNSSSSASFNISSADVSFDTNVYAKTMQHYEIITKVGTKNFYTFQQSEKNSDSLTVNASASMGDNVFQISCAGITIIAGQGINTFFVSDSIARDTEIISQNFQTTIYLQNSLSFTHENAKDQSLFGHVNLDNFNRQDPRLESSLEFNIARVYGSSVGEKVTGTIDEEVYYSSSNYDVIDLSGNNVTVSVGTGASVNLTGLGAIVYVDMNLTGELNLASDTGKIDTPTINANYGDSLLSLKTTDQLTIAQNKDAASLDIGSVNVYFNEGIFDIKYIPPAENVTTGSEVVLTGFNFLEGSNGADFYWIGDQSTIDKNKQLKYIATGSGNNIVQINDTSGALTVELGGGNNSVVLESGSSAYITTMGSDGINQSNIVLDSGAKLSGILDGNESVTNVNSNSEISLTIADGNHFISTAGASTVLEFDSDSISSTIINNYNDAKVGEADSYIASLDFTEYDLANLYIYHDASGSTEILAYDNSSRNGSSADVLLIGDLNYYLLETTNQSQDEVSITLAELLNSYNSYLENPDVITTTFKGTELTSVYSITSQLGTNLINHDGITNSQESGRVLQVANYSQNTRFVDNSDYGNTIELGVGSTGTEIDVNIYPQLDYSKAYATTKSELVRFKGNADVSLKGIGFEHWNNGNGGSWIEQPLSHIIVENMQTYRSQVTLTGGGGTHAYYGLYSGTDVIIRNSTNGLVRMNADMQTVFLESSGMRVNSLTNIDDSIIVDYAGSNTISIHRSTTDDVNDAYVFGINDLIYTAENTRLQFTGHTSVIYGSKDSSMLVYGANNTIRSPDGSSYTTTSDDGVEIQIDNDGSLLVSALSAFAVTGIYNTDPSMYSAMQRASAYYLSVNH
jgi:hypothetical protein